MRIGNHKTLTYDQKKMIVDIVNNGTVKTVSPMRQSNV